MLDFGVMLYAEEQGVDLLRAFLPDPFDNNLSTPALELYLASLTSCCGEQKRANVRAQA